MTFCRWCRFGLVSPRYHAEVVYATPHTLTRKQELARDTRRRFACGSAEAYADGAWEAWAIAAVGGAVGTTIVGPSGV